MSILIMILLISLLIVIHEVGHFIAARAFGIAVPKFGFGLPFGPTLFKTKIKDTEILVHALLLGGYVSFLDDEEHPEVPCDSPLRFQNKPAYQRAIVVSAGVVANIIAAIVLVMLTATIWGALPSGENNVYINKITAPANSPVYETGLEEGDLIYSVNGTRITYPSFISVYAAASYKFNQLVTPERVAKKLEQLKKLNPEIKEGEEIQPGTKVILPDTDLEAPIVFSDAYLKGLERNNNEQIKLTDEQTNLRNKIYDRKIFITKEERTLEDFAHALSDTTAPMNIVVIRDGKKLELKPLLVDESGKIGIEQVREEILIPTKNFKSIIVESIKFLFSTTYMMILGLIKLFTGQIPFKDLHGIIAITKIGSDIIAYQGLFKGIILTAMISINLAIMNLLPIPALDGGHLLFLAIEKIQGKALDEKILEKISSICFLLLITLMFFILFNDVQAIISKKFG